MMMLRILRDLRIAHKATENRHYESSMQDRRAPNTEEEHKHRSRQ